MVVRSITERSNTRWIFAHVLYHSSVLETLASALSLECVLGVSGRSVRPEISLNHSDT